MSYGNAGQYGPQAVLFDLGSGVPSLLRSTAITVKTSGGATATLYTDRTATTAASNPVSTDASGNLSFFAAPGAYTLNYTTLAGAVSLPITVQLDPADKTPDVFGSSTFSPLVSAFPRPATRPVQVAATLPTVTVTNNLALNTSGTLVNKKANAAGFYTSVAPNDFASLRFLGCGTPIISSASFPDQYGVRFTYRYDTTAQSGVIPAKVEFGFDGQVLNFIIKQEAASYYRIKVNGEYLTQYPQATGGTSGQTAVIAVDFGSRAVRLIELEMQCIFYGVNIQVNDTVWRQSGPNYRRVLWVGDSYAGGANGVQGISSFVQTASQLLGFKDYLNSGLGGTGYLATGSYVKFRDRLTSDVTSLGADLVVVAGGHNDTSFTNAAIQTEAALFFAGIKSALPAAEIGVFGPFFAGGTPGVYTAMQTAIFNAASGIANWTVDTCTTPYFTGSGHVGATTGTGNSDLYIGTDGVHPTQAGADYLGWRVAEAIKAQRLPA